LNALFIVESGIAKDFERAKYIKEAISEFCFSSALDIETFAAEHYKKRELSLRIDEQEFMHGVRRLWSALIDPETPVGLHDAYFKLWQMSRPKLRYDVILLDEAQDTNDALLDVINFQQHAQRVVVGDPHQAIYGFRGAKNIMSLINGQQLYLTESFRFSSPIAELATDLLTVFKGERKSLKGVASWKSQVLMPGEKTIDTGKKAIICRTNAAVFAEAAEACEKNKRVNVNIPDAALDEIVDAYYIFDGRRSRVKNSLMRKFNSFIEMLDYAESSGDRELMMRCKVVERYRDAIPELVQKIRKSQDASAQLTITTAHRAKGLEWDHVALCDDFPELMRGDEPAAVSTDPEDYVLAAEEANLYYVAITRARQTLVINEQLRSFVAWKSKWKSET
jgi:superfamily I DNA/RNA helicase